MRPSRLIGLIGSLLAGALIERAASSSSIGVTADQLDQSRNVQNEPLTQREIQLIARLLSDPSVFPREFKRWVTDHSSDTVDIAKSQVHGLINSQGSIIFSNASWEQLAIALCPMILPYPVETPPNGWLNCDGQMYLETQYPALFGFLGHRFDVLTSTGSFGVPDIAGRTIYGMDPAAGSFFSMPFGMHEGSPVGNRGPWHNHQYQDNQMVNVDVNAYNDVGGSFPRYSPQDIGRRTTGGGGTLREVPSFLTLNYIIASGTVPQD